MNYITMRKFGNMGRFANQLCQYAWLREYADIHHLELQLPHWVGESLFGIHTPPIVEQLPQQSEKYDAKGQPIPPQGDEYINKDFLGWAQFHTSYMASYKHIWWNVFRPVASIEERLFEATYRFQRLGHTGIGLHIRRGDYGRGIFYLTPIDWYLQWLEENWAAFDTPFLFIASEDRSLVEAFAKYHPVTVESLGVDLKGVALPNYNYEKLDLRRLDPVQLDFYPDFYFLSKCNVLVTPNSTFSFAAGLCNPNLLRFARSSLPHGKIIEENIWYTFPLQHDDVKDYPHLEGIALKSNPYW